eukprot:CAMPEP_0206618018 /NCGR_PEP_ID=MMETSP0325_2-20121206/59977_1 /ASSEMBLY_ACC=CAM_ASM_000347 /TAXON_ID=2866 /ORGANISM="Crypthecodinium cohnii, Strain Seligo" /LENGTH=207 /DNA_ID=CAMNT_0054140105 /DNA_START=119 /DNA_END=741 /DNA_ORIENTATION=-
MVHQNNFNSQEGPAHEGRYGSKESTHSRAGSKDHVKDRCPSLGRTVCLGGGHRRWLVKTKAVRAFTRPGEGHADKNNANPTLMGRAASEDGPEVHHHKSLNSASSACKASARRGNTPPEEADNRAVEQLARPSHHPRCAAAAAACRHAMVPNCAGSLNFAAPRPPPQLRILHMASNSCRKIEEPLIWLNWSDPLQWRSHSSAVQRRA